MLEIKVKTIPHAQHRYETVGDYWTTDKGEVKREVRVSEMGNWKYEFLVAIHEQIEQALCINRGISEELITKFDEEYEASRRPDDLTSEPGDDSNAPYRREHFFATSIERLIAAELGVDWGEYEKAIYNL